MKLKFGFCWFCLFLFAVLAVSGAGIITKYVCPGDSVQAFQNIRFNTCSSVVSLYRNGERNTLIASWSFENCILNKTVILPDYNDRVFLYSNGTVSIQNVHHWDQAKYIVYCQIGNNFMEEVVQIIVMVAPANDCIPQILHLGSSLFVSLEARSCGKPVATIYWKGYDFPAKTEPVLNLNPGNQDGIYYVCIEGPALTCVRNARDYCSNITIGGDKSPPILSETWDVKMVIFIMVGIVPSVFLVIAVILIRKRCRRNIVKQKPLLKKENELCIQHFEEPLLSKKRHQAAYYTPLKLSPTSTSLKGAVKNCRDNDNVRVASDEDEGRTDGREVKDKNSVPGSSRAISRSDYQSATSTSLKETVENCRDNGNVRVTSGENEGRTDGREVKDKNSVPGLSRAISRSDDQSATSASLKGAVENRRDNDNVRVTSGGNEGRTDGREVKDKNSVTGLSRSISRFDDQSDSEKSQHKQPLTTKPLPKTDTMREQQRRE